MGVKERVDVGRKLCDGQKNGGVRRGSGSWGKVG